MNDPTVTGQPIYSGDDTGNSEGSTGGFVLGIYFFFLFIVFILCYISYICNRNIRSASPLPFAGSVGDYHYNILPAEGLREDVLETFPTCVYSQIVRADDEAEMGRPASYYESSCSICLADYNAADMVRLLPECGHLFHVSCIDTWLKVHRTCPVCRNSLDFMDSLKHVFVS